MVETEVQVYLASASPRRRELLQQIGVHYEVLAVQVEETSRPGESPAAYVERLALDKARAGWAVPQRRRARPVLGADTVVLLDGQVLGKPRHREQAVERLLRLGGRSHQVLSAVALVTQDQELSAVSVSDVWFRPISRAEAQLYWRSGEPVDKAGGYGIQGLGAAFVQRLAGSYSGVMGLPLFETASLLKELGIDVLGPGLRPVAQA